VSFSEETYERSGTRGSGFYGMVIGSSKDRLGSAVATIASFRANQDVSLMVVIAKELSEPTSIVADDRH
jgi:hypothetical protein